MVVAGKKVEERFVLIESSNDEGEGSQSRVNQDKTRLMQDKDDKIKSQFQFEKSGDIRIDRPKPEVSADAPLDPNV